MDKNDEFDDNAGKHEDEFGLPDVEFQALEQEGEGHKDTSSSESDTGYAFPEDDKGSSKTSLIVALIIGAVLLFGGGGFLAYHYVIKPNLEKKKQEELAARKQRAETKKKEQLAKLEREKEEARKKATVDSIAQAEAKAKSRVMHTQGNIEVLNAPNGRYHVVVSSGIDDDLLKDYAKSLEKKGVDVKIIAPYGKISFYRLVIRDDYETYAKAQETANKIASDYPSQPWVLKY